jgi:hypothetical protein
LSLINQQTFYQTKAAKSILADLFLANGQRHFGNGNVVSQPGDRSGGFRDDYPKSLISPKRFCISASPASARFFYLQFTETVAPVRTLLTSNMRV